MNLKFLKYNLYLVLTLSFINPIYACDHDEDRGDLKRLEAFLGKNKPSMENLGHGRYRVNDDQFNAIFPSVSLLSHDYQGAVGFIENEFNDILKGQTVINAGTGTVVENNTDTIKVLTAAHVVRDKGTIKFTMGSMLAMPGNTNVTHFAVYTATRVFIHNAEDVAYLLCDLTTHSMAKNLLANYSMPRDHQLIDLRKKVTTYHYPFGVEDQRVNVGFIFKGTQEHTIPTLGGSSGAPIIYNGNIIGIHTSAGPSKGGTAEYSGETLEFSLKNIYVRLHSINPDLTTGFTERL